MKKMFLAAVAVSAVAAFADEVCEENATKQATNPMTEEVKDYVCVDGVWVEKGSKCAPGQHQTYTAPDGKTTNYVCNNEGSAWVEVAEGESSSSEVVPSSSETTTEGESSSSEVVPSSSETTTEGESSSSEVAGSSSSILLIDDFEDGDGEALIKDQYWYVAPYQDEATDVATFKNSSNKEDFTLFIANDNGGKVVQVTEINTTNKSKVSVGINLPEGTLGGCTEISYKFKGAAHTLTPTHKDEKAATGWNTFSYKVEESDSWKSMTIKVSDIKQPETWGNIITLDMGKIAQLAWNVFNGSNASFAIDDVACTAFDENYNPGSSSSTTSSGSGSGEGDLVDDMDDGNNVAEKIAEDAYWIAYKSNGASVSNPTDPYGLVAVDPAGYAYLSGISGITYGATTYPSAGIGLKVLGALGSCTAVNYDYKGSAHWFRAAMNGITPDKGYEHTSKNFIPAADDWTNVTVQVSDLVQPDPEGYWVPASEKKPLNMAQVYQISWIVDEKLTTAGTDLYVDNLRCVGGTVSKGTLPDPTQNNSSNNNSSTNKSTSPNNNTNPYAAIMGSAAQVGLKASVHGTTLDISVAKAGVVSVSVFDMMGHVIDSHSENMAAGTYGHSLAKLSQGSYMIRVKSGSNMQVLRVNIR